MGVMEDNATELLPVPAQSHVLVVGLVRNAQGKVRQDVLHLATSLRSFAAVHWLLIESDSSDRTTEELAALASELPRFRWMSLGDLRHRIPQRTARIAHCRNAYLNELESCPDYERVDYVVASDLDGMNHMLTEAAVLSCWDRNDWDVCTANQAGPYYDVWALRHPHWSPCDYKDSYRFLVQHGTSPEAAIHATLLSRMITIDPASPWIAVDSAFGGLGIYRRRLLTGLRYSGQTPSGDETCEHVAFHADLRHRGGRIFINPRMVNAARTEHAHALTQASRLHRWLIHAGKRLLGRRVADLA